MYFAVTVFCQPGVSGLENNCISCRSNHPWTVYGMFGSSQLQQAQFEELAGGYQMKLLEKETSSPSKQLIIAMYEQNWENVRHIKNERLWFTNIYAIVVAAVLSFLHSSTSAGIISVSLQAFIFLLSIIGFLISLRLKSELENYLNTIDNMVHETGLEAYSTHDEIERPGIQLLKFRWIFTIFYLVTSAGSFGLLIQGIADEL